MIFWIQWIIIMRYQRLKTSTQSLKRKPKILKLYWESLCAKIFFGPSKNFFAWKIVLQCLALHIFPLLIKCIVLSFFFLAEDLLFATSFAGATHIWRGESWERSWKVRGIQNPGSCHGPSQFRSSPPEQSLREVFI